MYDLAIVGAGPAGLNASIYASRYGVKNIIIGEPGGLLTKTHEIGNWLGTIKTTGAEFAQKCEEHARSYGAEIEYTLVGKIEKTDGPFRLSLENGKDIEARAVLIAMGTAHRHLDVPGETKFAGKGVSYCASCDGFFYRGKTVAVIGGNDSAVGAAVYLADITNKVYLVYRKDGLRAEKFWVESAEKNPKIEIIYNTNVIEIKGKDRLEELVLDNPHNGAASLKADGLFIEIGADPNSELMAVLGVALDDSRHVKINAEGMTNVEGVWAAGDITDGSNKFKQIVTAAAEGATAAFSIQRYLKKK